MLGPIIVSAIAGGLWWACRATGCFVRARVFLAWITGAGIAAIVGDLLASVIVWASRQLRSVVPSSWPSAIGYLIPWVAVALLAIGGYLTLHSIRNRPHPRAEMFAMSFASLAVIVGALLGTGFGDSLVNSYNHTTNNVVHPRSAK